MGLKESLLKAFEKQGNPWQEYTGPYGGNGWVNIKTGEVRYQDTRPAPGEGAQDDQHGAAEDVAAEPGEQVEEPLDDFAPVDMDLVDVGDPVVVADEAGYQAAELAGINEDGTVDVDLGETGIVPADAQDIHGAPAQPPPDGMEEGWQPVPRDLSEIEGAQLVEVYDIEAGEYVLAEVRFEGTNDDGEWVADLMVTETDEWSPDEDSIYEQGDLLGYGGEYNEDDNLALTTVEDPDYMEFDPEELEPFAPEAEDYIGEGWALNDSEGEEFILHNDDPKFEDQLGSEYVRATLENYDKDYNRAEFETEDGQGFVMFTGADKEDARTHLSNFDLFEAPIQWADPSAIPGIGGEEVTAAGVLAGQQVRLDHPIADGPIEGAPEVHTDDAGHEWLTIPEEPEVGDEVTVDSPTYDGVTMDGIVTDITDEGIVTVDDQPDNDVSEKVEVEMDAVHDLSAVSATTNPDHPYYIGDTLEAATDPFEEAEPDVADNLKAGDKVVFDGEVHSVENVTDTPLHEPPEVRLDDGTWLSADNYDLLEQAAVHDPVDPPNWAVNEVEANDWQPTTTIDEAGNPSTKRFQPEDVVHYYDEEDGEMQTASVEEHGEDMHSVELANGKEIDYDAVDGYLPTGSPPLPESVELPQAADPGSFIEYTEKHPHTGELTEGSGIVVSQGHSDMQVLDPETGSVEMVSTDTDETAIREYDRDADIGTDTDWASSDEHELAQSIEEAAGLEHSAQKLHSEDKKALKGAMMQHLPADAVQRFYDLQSEGDGGITPWKSKSGSSDAVTYEKAYKEALGLNAQTLEDKGVQHGGHPDDALVKAAAVASSISKKHFRKHYGESAELHRGTSTEEAVSTVARWIEDPTRDEYNPSFRAIQNFATKRSTAERFEAYEETGQQGAMTISANIDADHVAAMHDQLFTIGNNEGETEITIDGDVGTVPAERINLDTSAYGNNAPTLSKTPIEMGETEARNMVDYLRGVDRKFKDDISMNSDQWLENAIRMRDAFENHHGVNTHGHDFFEKVADEYRDRGKDPDSIVHPEAHDTNTELPTGIDEPEMLPEGAVVEYNDTASGITQEGYIEEVHQGPDGWQVEIEDDYGGFDHVDPEDIESIIDPMGATYGEGAENIEVDMDPDDLTAGDKVYYDQYGGPVAEGTIFDIKPESGEVQVGDVGDNSWMTMDRVGPLDPSENAGDGEGGGWQEDPDPSDLEPGDTARVQTTDGIIEGVYQGEDDMMGHEFDVSEADTANPDAVATYVTQDDIMAVRQPEGSATDDSGGLSYEEGEAAWYEPPDADEPGGASAEMVEIGEVQEDFGPNDEDLYVMVDDNGTVVQEHYADELSEVLSEPPDGDPGDPIQEPAAIQEGDWLQSDTHGAVQVDNIQDLTHDDGYSSDYVFDLVDEDGDYADALSADHLRHGEDPDEQVGDIMGDIEDDFESLDDSGYSEAAGSQVVDPDEGDTAVMDPGDIEATLEEGDEVWLEWPQIGDGKVGELYATNDAGGVFHTEEGGTVSVHDGKDVEVHVPTDDTDDAENEGSAVKPSEITTDDWGVSEQFEMTFPGDHQSVVTVMDVPDDSYGPLEVEDELDDRWLVWPDGDLEQV